MKRLIPLFTWSRDEWYSITCIQYTRTVGKIVNKGVFVTEYLVQSYMSLDLQQNL